MPPSTRFRPELVDPTAFIAPGAVVIGDVTIGARASVWFGAVVRADKEAVTIGPESNVQDNCTLHADPGFPCTLGVGVTVGHGAVVHGCTLEDNVLVGMNAVVMNGAVIGRDSLVAVGAVVTEGTIVPPCSMAIGVPAQVRTLAPERIEVNKLAAAHYVELAKEYAKSLAGG